MSTHDQLVDMAEMRFRDTANDVIAAADWSTYINTAYDEGNRFSPLWPWLEAQSTSVTVSASTRSVALPADTFQVNSVFSTTDHYPLVPLEGRTQHQRVYDFDATGTGPPEAYRIRNNNIEVYPLVAVNTTLTIDYVGSPAALSGSNEPVWPEHFHKLLVVGALGLAYEDDGNAKESDRRKMQFKDGLNDMLRYFSLFRHEGNFVIVDDWYDW